MTIKAKYVRKHEDLLKDTRPKLEKWKDNIRDPSNAIFFYMTASVSIYVEPLVTAFADLIFVVLCLYFVWLMKQPNKVPFKLPKSANRIDPNHRKPNGSLAMAEGIMYLGNTADGEEVWFNNNDARTHFLYLGTTGAGKTFGLKSIICNALCWSSGYVYIDGKADTDLWSTLSALARRFGRDDDVLIMNYMTGNASGKVPSNTLNPFSTGSASYLVNMLTSLMPDSGGDNAMWKDRAVALLSAIMPCLVWKRENQSIPLSIGVIRRYLTFPAVIKLSRDKQLPEVCRRNVRSYLDELPGYVDDAFDDNGDEKKDNQNIDTSTPRQQHGFLSMQFTRALSSLGEDYGFIFDTQAADIDMNDVVLNRRLLVTLIPALEKSGDETANLGKIISAALKGMMGATLGNTVEGDTATAIENKPTTSSTPFIAVFDEVGYYAAQGMAVMAAQARSLGFCLIFAGQDMPALEKRVKEEAKSITANCNIKLFGKLEDPTETKDFFEKSVGQSMVTEVANFEKGEESKNASIQTRARASYSELKYFQDGQAICTFGKALAEIKIYNHDIGHAKAMRVHHFLPIIPPSDEVFNELRKANEIVEKFRDPDWNPSSNNNDIDRDVEALAEGFGIGLKAKAGFVKSGIFAVANLAKSHGILNADKGDSSSVQSTRKEVVEISSASQQSASTLTASDLLGVTKPAAVPSEPKSPEIKVATPVSTQPIEINKQPISWADLIGMDKEEEPESEAPSISRADENSVMEEVVSISPAIEENTASDDSSNNNFVTWAQLIGAEEPVIEQVVNNDVSQIEAQIMPNVQDAVAIEVDSNIEQSVQDSSYEEIEVTEQSFETVTWAQLIGAEEPTNNVTDNAYVPPEQQPSSVIATDDSSVNNNEGHDEIKSVSWTDIINSGSAADDSSKNS